MRQMVHRALKRMHHALPEWLKAPVRRWYLGTLYYRVYPEVMTPGQIAERDARRNAAARPESGLASELLAHPGAPSRRPTLVCLPVIAWDFRYQRPQQLMVRIAARGWNVVYVDPALDGVPCSGDGSRPRDWMRALTDHVIGLKCRAVHAGGIHHSPLGAAAGLRLAAELATALRALGVAEATLFVESPFWAPVAIELARRRGYGLVYDCLDDHAGFGNLGAEVVRQEGALVRASELVIASSHALARRLEPLARRVVLIPNGCDDAHFAAAEPHPRLRDLPRPRLGYFGAIADWFDCDLVAAAARAYPHGSVVLIGAAGAAEQQALQGLPNLHLLGECDYAVLPSHLAAFDVALIPFRRTPLTLATHPVKLFEYLAAGKPVASVRLPEIECYEDVVHFGDSPAAFAAAVGEALAAPAAEAGRRQEVARRNRWDARAEALDVALREAAPGFSVVLVTWNNWDYTRLCLDRLLACLPPSGSEIVIVDNASSDGTRLGLYGYACQHPSVRVLFNDENRGFAAACNQGLRAARQDRLLLLNNDTLVTPGWLRRLARWLEDPAVGLVGPVTNTAGNQARIDTHYEDLAGLDRLADERGWRVAGRGFDIPMLAMFCLAMRRDVFEAVGGLDERFEVGFFEDDDYARRVRAAGKRLVCAEDVFIHHFGGTSFGRLDGAQRRTVFERNRQRFEAKWAEAWVPHTYSRPPTAETPRP